MSAQKMIAGAFIGLIAGATLGVLLAPDKGERTRKKIKSKSKDFKKQAGRKYEDILSSLQQNVQNVKEKVEDLSDDVKDKATSVTNKLTSA